MVSPAPLLVSSGVANVLGSFVSSYPITGSFGRWVAGGRAGLSLGLCDEGALQDLEWKKDSADPSESLSSCPGPQKPTLVAGLCMCPCGHLPFC